MHARVTKTRLIRWIPCLLAALVVSSCHWSAWRRPTSKVSNDQNVQRPRLVWVSLDGFQPEALDPWVRLLSRPHPKGLQWLIQQAHGRSDLKVINPTITAPSHISTITCAGAGLHGILDNNTWTGHGTTSGFSQPYPQENWISKLRSQGLRVGVSLYPSIDGSSDGRSADIGLAYDNPGSQTQMVTVSAGSTQAVLVPDRSATSRGFALEVSADGQGRVSVKTPWRLVEALEVAKPVDVFFSSRIQGVERKVAISMMLVSAGAQSSVAISPVQMMPAYDGPFAQDLDRGNVIFSSLKDYRLQGQTKAFLAAMEHRRQFVFAANQILLARDDLDVAFFYFEDLDALLHAFYRDEVAMSEVVDYLNRFDRDLGQFMASIPPSSDLVVLGDHGMSAIAYVLNARKILGADLATRGTVLTGGGALYLYPPEGDITQDPPATLNLEAAADQLRQMTFDLTGKKLFGNVIARGSKTADDEGLSGKRVPWIMAFANDGVAFNKSVEDRLLLARAKWAVIPEQLRVKYPDPIINGELAVPIPAGQHGHWNDIPQMRTRLVLEGPRLSKLNPRPIEKTLQLVPAVADSLGLPRPESCAH
jgi:hypothetical protein